LVAAFGLTSSCGGKAADVDSYDTVPAEVRPNYCEEFAGSNRHCGPQSSEFEVADALERVVKDEDVPSDAVLVRVGGVDVAPDGWHLGLAGHWDFTFVFADGESTQFSVYPDRTDSGQGTTRPCSAADAVEIAGFKERIQLATVRVTQEVGFTFEPDTFTLMAGQQSGCVSNTGEPSTFVRVLPNFQSGVMERYTVEFNEEFPNGTVCVGLPGLGCTDSR
jgi:hypothetical protein